MKKLLLALGSIAAVAAPVASVVACGAPKAPAPKAIDTTAANKLAAKIAKGLGSADTTDPAVKTLPNGNFEFTFNMPTKPSDTSVTEEADITITPTGDVVAAKLGSQDLVGDHLDDVKNMAKKATENHDNDSLPAFKIERDTTITAIMDKMTLSIPVLPTGADYDQTETFNEAVTAFQKQYDEKAVELAKEKISDIDTLTLTEDGYVALQVGADSSFNDLTDDIISDLGFVSKDVDMIKDIEKSGVSLQVQKTKNNEILLLINDNGSNDQVNFNHGSLTSSLGSAVIKNFAVTK